MQEIPGSQVFAFLLKVGAVVEVAAESTPSTASVELPNSDAGTSQLAERVGPLRNALPSFFCFGTEPGVELKGELFEALVQSEIPRFILAHPFFVAYCERTGQSTSSASSLLNAFREAFPAAASAA